MKKLVVELNTKSIEQTINYLKHLRKNIKKMMDEFLEFACLWVIDRANNYVAMADLGDLVKLDIRNGWEYNIVNGVATIRNTTSKAVFVEFGVGIVGQGQPHPNASVEGYEYNIQKTYTDKNGIVRSTKDENGMWYFWTNHNELDLPLSAVEDIRGHDDFRGVKNEKGKRIVVGTRGAQGVMYAYNAIVDAKMDLQNPDGDFAREWAKLKERYLV
jgi:hypothetical protein